MAQKLLAWDDVTNRIKRTTSDAGSVAIVTRSQRVSLISGTTSVAATYSSAMPSASYSLTVTIQNTIDSTPQFQPLIITAQDANGFTVKWNAALDSSNYILNYQAMAFV